MRARAITPYLKDLALSQNKMVFLSGPRQAGKTTLSKSLLKNTENYFNWDYIPFRKKWLLHSEEVAQNLLEQRHPIIVLDEFHKNLKWKNQLKGFYDQHGRYIQIIVTGSAKLNTFRKGADSLIGRFLHFHLLPYSLGELIGKAPFKFTDFINFLQAPQKLANSEASEFAENLMRFGGFPEPFEKQRDDFHQIWKKNRSELLVRQDVKELSNIFDIGHVEILASFLPERVGCCLSVQSLREDLDVAHTTVSRWLLALQQVYYHFEVRPYSKSISRSLKKEPKMYLYDWSEVEAPGPRFENMIASHLLKLVHFYSDTGQADLKLHYLRDKDAHEVDFLITQKNKPLFTVEAKLSQRTLDTNFYRFQKKTRAPHFQIIQDKSFFRKYDDLAHVLSFEQFFAKTP